MDKERIIWINGEPVKVTEDVYLAFKRPAWRERKQSQVRADNERSLEKFMDDGLDIPSEDALVEEIAEDRLLLDTLMAALAELTDDERFLIDRFFYQEKSEREISAETGVPRNTIVYRKNKVLDCISGCRSR